MTINLIPQAYASCTPGNSDFNLADCLMLNKEETIQEKYQNPSTLVNLIVANLFLIAGIIIFIMIIVAGFMFIKGGKKGTEESKNILTSAIIGFLVMFAAYWIVQIIKVVTGADIPI